MHLRGLQALVLVLTSTILSPSANAQEDCSNPIVIPDGTGGRLDVDLATFTSDYENFCGLAIEGPDMVFLADGSDTKWVLSVSNRGEATVTLTFIASFSCAPMDSCEAIVQVTVGPDQGFSLTPTISKLIYLVVVAPPELVSLPLRFRYTLGEGVAVEPTRWSQLKTNFASQPPTARHLATPCSQQDGLSRRLLELHTDQEAP